MMPKYEHKQKSGIPFYLILLILLAVVITTLTFPENPKPLVAVVLSVALLLLAILTMSELTITIDNKYIWIRFGMSVFRKRYLLEDIANCQIMKNRLWHGWGIHYIGKCCWLYNIAGKDAVELTYINGKKTRIGTDEPEKLAEAIREAIGQTAKTAV